MGESRRLTFASAFNVFQYVALVQREEEKLTSQSWKMEFNSHSYILRISFFDTIPKLNKW